jgi:hypothetical protein
MNVAIFWDITPCSPYVNHVYMFTCESVSYHLTLFLARVISSTLKMEATRSSDTSVYNKPTGRYIPEDGVLQICLTSVHLFLVSLQLPVNVLYTQQHLETSCVCHVFPGVLNVERWSSGSRGTWGLVYASVDPSSPSDTIRPVANTNEDLGFDNPNIDTEFDS